MIFGDVFVTWNTTPVDIDFDAILADYSVAKPAESPRFDFITTPAGMPLQQDPDVFGNLTFVVSQPIRAAAHGLLIVDDDTQPVFDGEHSVRFEVRPEDTNASATWDDAGNDRNRYEINEQDTGSTNGNIITWDENFFIPYQEGFRPKGGNALFLTQINFKYQHNYGALAYLEVGQNGELLVRTHVDFSWDIKQQYVIAPSVYDKWNNVRFEVYSTPQSNGYLRVYLNGSLVVEEYRATIPTTDYSNTLKLGIYNAYKSRAYEPYNIQVAYFDGIKKTVSKST